MRTRKRELVGLYCSAYPRRRSTPGLCKGCGHTVRIEVLSHRLAKRASGYGDEGLLCMSCRKRLGEAQKGVRFSRIDATKALQAEMEVAHAHP